MSKTPAVMFMGTGSDVGKSVLVAGLARAYTRRGLKVLPFKPQNMSNNAAVTDDGGEIGRAQALQAMAAKVPTTVHMNPVLLKPESESGSQIVVQGKRWETLTARTYFKQKQRLLPKVIESFDSLLAQADVVLVEGAGSPAEINLRSGDIANMGFAETADVPVVLIGDIERGGVIASLVGTKAVLPTPDADRIKAFIVNRFRGDPSLFDDGVRAVADQSGWAPLGVVPYFPEARHLPAEDSLGLQGSEGEGRALIVAVPELSRIANFDDLDPLRLEPRVNVQIIRQGEPVPGDVDVVLLSGSKSTIGDLKNLRANGWDIDIAAHLRRGGKVIGLCGGYQMLGREISDPAGIEGPPETVPGLGFLDVKTVLSPQKRTVNVKATHVESGTEVTGYEIHIGGTDGPDRARPFFNVAGEPEGAISADRQVMGTYLHGVFQSDRFRQAFLNNLGYQSTLAYQDRVDQTLDALADHLEQCLNLDKILDIAQAR